MTNQTKLHLTQKYDLLANKFQQTYLEGRERGRKAMTTALEKTQQQLVKAGEFSSEQGQDLIHYLTRDLEQTIADMEQLGDAAKEKLHPSRLGAGALSSLVAVLDTADTTLHTLSQKAKAKLTYKSGELTSAGTLTCESCGQKVHLKTTSLVTPCEKCKATQFSKGY